MQDSKRPKWLIELLCYVKAWFPYDNLNQMPDEHAIAWLECSLDKITYTRRTARYKLTECIKYEIAGPKLTIFSINGGKPMLEFEIREADLTNY